MTPFSRFYSLMVHTVPGLFPLGLRTFLAIVFVSLGGLALFLGWRASNNPTDHPEWTGFGSALLMFTGAIVLFYGYSFWPPDEAQEHPSSTDDAASSSPELKP